MVTIDINSLTLVNIVFFLFSSLLVFIFALKLCSSGTPMPWNIDAYEQKISRNRYALFIMALLTVIFLSV